MIHAKLFARKILAVCALFVIFVACSQDVAIENDEVETFAEIAENVEITGVTGIMESEEIGEITDILDINLDISMYAFPNVTTNRSSVIWITSLNYDFYYIGTVGGTFFVTNNSNRNLMVVHTSRLEKKRDGVWHEVVAPSQLLGSRELPAGGYLVFEWETEWLEPGKYRFLRTFYCIAAPNIFREVYAEFTVLFEPPTAYGMDVTMEVLPDSISPWGAFFRITNNSDFNVIFTNSYRIGSCCCRRAMSPHQLFRLEEGEQKIIHLLWNRLTPGEHIVGKHFYKEDDFSIRKEVFVDIDIRPDCAICSTQPEELNDDFTTGITLEMSVEATGRNPGEFQNEIFLTITNNTDSYIMLDDGFDVIRNINGRWEHEYLFTLSRATNVYSLPPSEQIEISRLTLWYIRPGFYKISKGVAVGTENPETARVVGISVEFLREDDSISPEITGIHMVVPLGSRPTRFSFSLTNGFHQGMVYFNREYRLQQYTNGLWQDISPINTPVFLEYTHAIAPRQRYSVEVMNWIGIYGELPDGEYRIGKTFWHHDDDGEVTRYEIYAPFTLPGEFNPNFSVFRGIVDRFYPGKMYCDCIPIGRGYLIGDFYLEDEDYWQPILLWAVVENEFVAAINARGEPILLSDIPPGSVVDIRAGHHIGSDGGVDGDGVYFFRIVSLVRIVE